MKLRKQIYKIIKRIVFIFIVFAIIGAIVSYFSQKWLEYHLVDIMNKNETRAYNINYEHLDLKPSFKGFKLEGVSIEPRNKYQGTIINCKIHQVKVDGLNWRDLVLRKQANINELSFVIPDFELTIAEGDTSLSASSKDVQYFFSDILSRVHLKNFRLIDGAFIWYKQKEKLKKIGHIGKINFEAKDIETDSLQWKNLIPFKLGELSSRVEDIMFQVDEHSALKCSSIVYNPKHSNIILSNLSFKINKSKKQLSQIIGRQSDILEFDLKSLIIKGLDANSDLYGDPYIRSNALVIDGFVLNDYKNKNEPAVDTHEKPMFSKMVSSIPFDLNVDTILIMNTVVTYTEVAKGKSKGGTIKFNNLNGSIYRFTTLDSLQKVLKTFDLNLVGNINGDGKLKVNFNIPYAQDVFRFRAQLEDFKMQQLNTTIKPLLGIIVEAGYISMLKFDMKANNRYSENKMILHYDDLKLIVVDENKVRKKKRRLVSSIANTLMRACNLPSDKNYTIANYSTKRNIYRAPFNLIWFSVQDGLKEIIPSKVGKELMAREKTNIKKGKHKLKKK